MSLHRSSVLYNSQLIGSAFPSNKLFLEVHCPTEQIKGTDSIDGLGDDNYHTPLNSLESEDLETNGITKKNAFVNTNNELKYTYEIKKEYNPYLIPPDWKAAKRHGVKI